MTTPVKEVKVYKATGYADTMDVGNNELGLMIRFHDKEHQKILPLDSTVECTVYLDLPIAEEKKVETSIAEIKEVCSLYGINEETTAALIKYFSAGEL